MWNRLLQDKFFKYLNYNCQEIHAMDFYEACHNNWGIATACMRAGLFSRWISLCKGLDEKNKRRIEIETAKCEKSMAEKNADEDMLLSVWLCTLIPEMPYIAGFFWNMEITDEIEKTSMEQIVADVADWYENMTDFVFEIGDCYDEKKRCGSQKVYKIDLLLSAIKHHLFSTYRNNINDIRKWEDAFLRADQSDKKKALGEFVNAILFHTDVKLRYNSANHKFEEVENVCITEFLKYKDLNKDNIQKNEKVPKRLVQEEILGLVRVAECYMNTDSAQAYENAFEAKSKLDTLIDWNRLTEEDKKLIREVYGRVWIKALKKTERFEEYVESMKQFETIATYDIVDQNILIESAKGIEETNAPIEIRNDIFFAGLEKMISCQEKQKVSKHNIGNMVNDWLISFEKNIYEKDSIEDRRKSLIRAEMFCKEKLRNYKFIGYYSTRKKILEYTLKWEVLSVSETGDFQRVNDRIEREVQEYYKNTRGFSTKIKENTDVLLMIGDFYLEINQKNIAKKYYVNAQESWEKVKEIYKLNDEQSEEYSRSIENKVRTASFKTAAEEEQERNESVFALLSKYQLNSIDENIVDEILSLDREFARRLCKEYKEFGKIKNAEEIHAFMKKFQDMCNNKRKELAVFYKNIAAQCYIVEKEVSVMFNWAAMKQWKICMDTYTTPDVSLWEQYTNCCLNFVHNIPCSDSFRKYHVYEAAATIEGCKLLYDWSCMLNETYFKEIKSASTVSYCLEIIYANSFWNYIKEGLLEEAEIVYKYWEEFSFKYFSYKETDMLFSDRTYDNFKMQLALNKKKYQMGWIDSESFEQNKDKIRNFMVLTAQNMERELLEGKEKYDDYIVYLATFEPILGLEFCENACNVLKQRNLMSPSRIDLNFAWENKKKVEWYNRIWN